jgi:poly(hydroxyalkanoate) granule-associated protein
MLSMQRGNEMATKRKFRKTARRTVARRAATRAPQGRLLDTVHQIWLAGLGAASKASQGAPRLMDDLVSEGARVHAEARGVAEKALRGLLESVQTSIATRVGEARGQAAETLNSLEKIFQTRVHRALAQLGVPSAEEVESLSKRIDALNANIDRFNGDRRKIRARGAGRRAAAAAAAH